jgi:hypothetical protein
MHSLKKLYLIQIIDQMITTGLQRVSKYHVLRKESLTFYIETIKIISR